MKKIVLGLFRLLQINTQIILICLMFQKSRTKISLNPKYVQTQRRLVLFKSRWYRVSWYHHSAKQNQKVRN